jgi:hypothetical protein
MSTRFEAWRAGGLLSLLGLVAIRLFHEAAQAEVVLETQNLRLEIRADGRVKSLTARELHTELTWTAEAMPFASVYRGGDMAVGSQEDYAEHQPPVYRGGKSFPASAVSLTGNTLTVRFDQANVTATYRITTSPHYLAFKLQSLAGDPIDRIDLVQLRVQRLPNLGPWINVAYDDRFGVCLCAGNIRTDAGMNQYSSHVEMRAVATREVALEGATAVLFGCAQPRERFLDAMEIVERDFQMPAGAKNRRSPVQQYSYLWCSPTPDNVEQYIAVAKRAGFRMILFSYWGFTEGAGHFRFNKRFPRGIEDLRAVTDRIRAAGLKVGLHIHHNKADRTDPYVTPVPDERLHQVRKFTLTEALDDKTASVRVQENPAGSPLAEGRRILKVDKELISYRTFSTEPPYQFTGCERGHLKTMAGTHNAGAVAGLVDVDDWTKFIRFDQNTDIQAEAARRIAEIANATGPYDMVYFDGAEDVHDPYWYYVVKAQYEVYRLIEPPPRVCETAMNSHYGWHMMSRGNAYDLPGNHIKNFCHEIACRTAAIRALDFTRMEFGWIFELYRNMGPDALEYVASRGAGWDCPMSLSLTLDQVAAHPRAEDCFEVLKTWEEARLSGKLTEAQRAMLRTQKDHRYIKMWDAVFRPEWTNAWSKADFNDQEHHLFVNEKGEYELVPIQEVPGVAGGRAKAYIFQRPAQPRDTYVLAWATQGETRLKLPLSPEALIVMRPFGTRLPFEREQTNVVVSLSTRRYLQLAGIGPDQAMQLLRAAK